MLARMTARSAVRAPRVAATPIAVRFYSDQNSFNKKEKAHEDQYARKHEQEQLEKLRKQIADKQAELEKLQKEHDEINKKN
ncbi:hypothetical protein BD309DRAFT_1082217 [Dichomitus squalens]|uniref:ATPase inhibitor, mitochondrial n=1 Tax=Dichomitus squalens TaxID=114155 RepID=A0A4Q9PN65_9APHY|nr:hypothetical protein BD309DRAFT_1082217 [Dichomitus squalens]TBU55687.1 hypothetical protein BD310DRAFT_672307 [Dichomitus squalens]